ncbi:MAG: hypothetical protein R3F49_12455 [Planctomycetota bacterium]
MSRLSATRRVAACLLAAASVVCSTELRAQSVIVCWGDSILAGFNSSGNTTTPTGPAPFGDPIPGAHRWDAVQQGWIDVTPFQNHFGTSADPIYGLAAGWRRFHGGDIYIVSLAVSGSDATPLHPNPLASWHPSVPGGAFERLATEYLSPALATLAQPDIRAVCFAAGNNYLLPTFDSDINTINSALSTFVPWSTPRYLAIKTYLGTANDAQTLVQRQAIDQWAATSSRRHAVETVSIPARTGGLVDGFHLSHYGSIFLGFWAAVTEYFHL